MARSKPGTHRRRRMLATLSTPTILFPPAGSYFYDEVPFVFLADPNSNNCVTVLDGDGNVIAGPVDIATDDDGNGLGSVTLDPDQFVTGNCSLRVCPGPCTATPTGCAATPVVVLDFIAND
jgi:hypothetical protein